MNDTHDKTKDIMLIRVSAALLVVLEHARLVSSRLNCFQFPIELPVFDCFFFVFFFPIGSTSLGAKHRVERTQHDTTQHDPTRHDTQDAYVKNVSEDTYNNQPTQTNNVTRKNVTHTPQTLTPNTFGFLSFLCKEDKEDNKRRGKVA